MIHNDKLSKIFEIYRDLNRNEKIEINTEIVDTLTLTKPKILKTSKYIKLTITPNDFTIRGNLNDLNKDNLGKVLENTKNYIDKELENLRSVISNLKNKL